MSLPGWLMLFGSLACSWCGDDMAEPDGGVIDDAGELTIVVKSVVERIIATGRAIGGNGGGGSIVLYCGYWDFGLRDRPCCTCNA